MIFCIVDLRRFYVLSNIRPDLFDNSGSDIIFDFFEDEFIFGHFQTLLQKNLMSIVFFLLFLTKILSATYLVGSQNFSAF